MSLILQTAKTVLDFALANVDDGPDRCPAGLW